MIEMDAIPKYVVLVIRQNDDNSISSSVSSFDANNRKGAFAKYYTECTAATNAEKPIHLVQIMTTAGIVIKNELFENPIIIPDPVEEEPTDEEPTDEEPTDENNG